MASSLSIRLRWLQLLLGFFNMPSAASNPDGTPQEFCEAETFSPSCQTSHLVLMKSARYGILYTGRCITPVKDIFDLGCGTNVLKHMDEVCSGRPSCSVRIPDGELERVNTCSKNYRVFLEAAYTCIRVLTHPCQFCNKDHVARVETAHNSEGYLASASNTPEYNCGSAHCPWLIRITRGQRLNLTLYDFGSYTSSMVSQPCHTYGTIQTSTDSHRPINICRSWDRVSHVHITDGSEDMEIKISFISHSVYADKGQFMIHYKVVGCGTVKEPEFGWVKYEGSQERKATVGCHNSYERYQLKCKNSTWEGVNVDSIYCPETPLHPNHYTLPLGVLIAIIVGIALVIGVLILTVGLVCLRRCALLGSRHQGPATRRQDMSVFMQTRRASDFQGEESASTPLRYVKNPSPEPKRSSTSATPANIRENVYMERRPLPSIPNADDSEDDTKSQKVQVYRTSSGREHYHNPRLVVHTRSEPARPPLMYTRGTYHPHHHGAPSGSGGGGGGGGGSGEPTYAGAGLIVAGPIGPSGLTFAPGEDPQYFVLDPEETHVGGEAACSASCAPSPMRPGRGGVRSDKQKSPEEENAENFCKEVAHNLNSSCEIPTVSTVTTADCGKQQQQGNSSWP